MRTTRGRPGIPAPVLTPALVGLAFFVGVWVGRESLSAGGGPAVLPGPGEMQVSFSRAHDPQGTIRAALDGAQTGIQVAMYYLTDQVLAEGLIGAQRRGVRVQVYLDKSQARHEHSRARELAAAGVEVRISAGGALMHHKFAVVDEDLVLTGSYNWTKAAAERNAENLLVIRQPEAARVYRQRFTEMWAEYDARLTEEVYRSRR